MSTSAPSIEAHRRQVLLSRRLQRAAVLLGLALVGWDQYLLYGAEVMDAFYSIVSLWGLVTALSRVVMFKVTEIPSLVRGALGTGPHGDACWTVIAAHRREVLGPMLQNFRVWLEDAAIDALDREDLATLVRRADRWDWPRIARVYAPLYALGTALVVWSVLTHTGR